MNQAKTKSRAASVSVLSNSLLVIGKLIVGLLIGSVSVLSEAIHSGIDLVAALIAWWAVKASSAPADEEHPFGHGKFENLSGAVEALLILVAAVWIVVESVRKLIHPTPVEGLGLGIAVMGISATVNFFVSSWLMKVGRQTDSVALIADAWHLRTDVYTSSGVMLGLAATWAANWLFPHESFDWIDPVVALLVALFIFKAAVNLTLGAVRDLLDSRLPLEELGQIQKYLANRSDLLGFHDLRTRKAGGWRFVEVHLELPPEMSVRESHSIAHSVSLDIQGQLPSTSVLVHVDPSDEDAPSSRQNTATRLPMDRGTSQGEWLPLVDERGVRVGKALRCEAHGNPALLHPVVHCLVFNSAGALLLQLRSAQKDVQPGRWDTSVGGHVGVDESIEAAVLREIREEIGLAVKESDLRFLYRYVLSNPIERELVHTFSLEHEGPFRAEPGEIDELRFWSAQEIRAALGSGRFTPNFEDEFARCTGFDLRSVQKPGLERN